MAPRGPTPVHLHGRAKESVFLKSGVPVSQMTSCEAVPLPLECERWGQHSSESPGAAGPATRGAPRPSRHPRRRGFARTFPTAWNILSLKNHLVLSLTSLRSLLECAPRAPTPRHRSWPPCPRQPRPLTHDWFSFLPVPSYPVVGSFRCVISTRIGGRDSTRLTPASPVPCIQSAFNKHMQ